MTQLTELKSANVGEIIAKGPEAIADLKRLINEEQKKAKAATVEIDAEIDPTLDLLINNFGWDRLWNRALVKRKTHKPVATGKAAGKKAKPTTAAVDALKNLGIKPVA